MSFHKLLEKQLDQYLSSDYTENHSFKDFIQAINDAYIAYEMDADLMKTSFGKTIKKYDEFSESLKKEYGLKENLIENQSEPIKFDEAYKEIKVGAKSDLHFISKYLNRQFSKNKETEDRHSRTVGLLNTLMAHHQSGVVVEDEMGKILYANQAFCDMFYISVSPETLIGVDFTDSGPGSKDVFKEVQTISRRINDILTKREIVVGELFETLDHRFLEIEYIPLIIDDESKGHFWKYTDATQRINAQTLLEQSEERNRLMMNAALNAIVNIDNNGKITFWNNQAERIFGWKKEEVLGKTFIDAIISDSNIEEHGRKIEQFLKTGRGSVLNKHLELEGLKKNGDQFPIEVSITPIKQGDEIFFCTFIRDISERKKAEINLKLLEEKYRNIIANVNLGLIEVDNNEIIQFANQSFSNMSGYEVSEIIGKRPADVFILEENLALIKSKMELRNEGVSDIYQIPVKNKRGELRWWSISGGPNYDDNGNLVGSIGIHLDITDQKHLEIALEKEKIKAEQASKAKEAFLANMSHEIRTPLNAIIGFLRELSRQKLTDVQKKYIDNSSIASKHLLAIINNVLDISKIEAGEMSLDNQDFIFEKTINNVITVLTPLAKQKGLNLVSAISNTTYQVFKGDTLRLEQILFNLIGNALKFTSKGDVAINCEVVKDSRSFQELRISISDTGIGMDKAFVDNIFRKFSQEDAAVTQKFGGTGLGMAITNELVQLMKGKIQIESEKNKGTTIHVTISLLKGNLKNLAISDMEEKISSIDGLSILLVEDNEMNRMVAQNSLQYYNCKVTEAENGLVAIKILEKEHFDVILMDVQMPEMDGIAATKIIRSKLNITIPIIALTANAFKTEIEKFKNAGMDDYITKPFDENVLIETIARHTTNKIETNSLSNHFLVEEKFYNLSTIINLSRGNNDFVNNMINIFINQTTSTIEKVETAILSKDFVEVSKLMHKIKPSIEGMGVVSIVDEIKLLEKSAKEIDDKDLLTALFSKIKITLLQVVIQLKKYELTE